MMKILKTTLQTTLKTSVSTKEIMIRTGKHGLTLNLHLHSAIKLPPQPMKSMMPINTKLMSEIIKTPRHTFKSRAQKFHTTGDLQLRPISRENWTPRWIYRKRDVKSGAPAILMVS